MTDTVALASAIADVGVALGTIATAIIAYTQLKELNAQQKIQGDREKQWQTIRVCQRYFTDPALTENKKAIWIARGNGAQPKISNPQSVKRDAISILNFLDGIAIGVAQGVFIKGIVKDNLENVIVDSVDNFLNNGMGAFDIKKEHLTALVTIAKEFANREPGHKAFD